MQPVKLGIIGCGIAARDLHWPALKELKDQFEIVQVCNHTEPKAKSFSQLVGDVPYVLDYKEVLENPDVEAVDIILPIHLICQATKDALEAGKHVMVEKPLGANLAEAKEMLSFETHYPQVKMVGENFRYHPLLNQARSYLDQNLIGKVYGAVWNIFHYIDESINKYAQTQWRIDHKYKGGFITDGGIHNIAALRVLFDDIIGGSAFTKSVNSKIGEIDTLSFQFKAPNNVYGVLNLFLSASNMPLNQLHIFGKNGSMVIENLSTITIKTEREEFNKNLQSDGGYRGEFEDFYQAIRNNRKVISSFEQAYRDLEVMLGALESAEKWPGFEVGG